MSIINERFRMIDTHAHIYLDDFAEDRDAMMDRLVSAGVERVYLPNIDSRSIPQIRELMSAYPEICRPMMGLHPCSVKDDWKAELAVILEELESGHYVAIGETGLDAYWDKTTLPQQEEALRVQIDWAVGFDLPLILHTRDTMDRTIDLVRDAHRPGLTGIFHCFNGTEAQARRIIDLGFFLGIGGVYTYKNARMEEQLRHIPMEHLVLETDAPYLSPVPHRGKRNEPSYLKDIVTKLAQDRQMSEEEVVRQTSLNARRLFREMSE